MKIEQENAWSVLAELVALKDLKDEEARLRQRHIVAIKRDLERTAHVDAMRDDYNRRKPLAWAAARRVVLAGEEEAENAKWLRRCARVLYHPMMFSDTERRACAQFLEGLYAHPPTTDKGEAK